jgi:hypothetical protein
MVARRAHNPKVVGSNPAPATNFSGSRIYTGSFGESHEGILQGFVVEFNSETGYI